MANETFEILRILVDNHEERFSIRKLSKLRDINYKSAYNAVKKLQDKGLVDLEKIGNTIICTFTRRFDPLVFEVEYQRKEDFKKNKDFNVICSRLEELKFQFVALLFGSYAKKSQGKGSDIDLLVISENEREVKRAVSLIPLKIHLTAVTNEEFDIMAKSKEFSVVSEAMKNNIILVGIEDYYRMIRNA